MPNPTNCALCGSAATFSPITADELEIKCASVAAATALLARPIYTSRKTHKNRGAVNGWIRRQNAMGVTPNIGSDDVDHLRSLTKPPFRERVEQYLLAAAEISPRLDHPLKPVTTISLLFHIRRMPTTSQSFSPICNKKVHVRRHGCDWRTAIDA